MSMQLAVIAGGNGYIGSALATTFRNAGWRVITLGRKAGSTADDMLCDITDEVSVQTTVALIVTHHGPIDACIHSASPALERVTFLNASPESFRAHLRTAVDGTYFLAQHVIPHMTANGAFIALTSNVVDHISSDLKMGAYPFAKCEQQSVMQKIAVSDESQRIRVHTVMPHFLPGGLNNDLPAAIRDHLAMQEDGTKNTLEDTAALVLTIASNPLAYPSGRQSTP